ncbi:unnamed protein product, partial [Tetraodon nigroviridis]
GGPDRPPSLPDIGQLGRLLAVRPGRGGRENVCERITPGSFSSSQMTPFVPAPQLLLEHRRIQTEPTPVQVNLPDAPAVSPTF